MGRSWQSCIASFGEFSKHFLQYEAFQWSIKFLHDCDQYFVKCLRVCVRCLVQSILKTQRHERLLAVIKVLITVYPLLPLVQQETLLCYGSYCSTTSLQI